MENCLSSVARVYSEKLPLLVVLLLIQKGETIMKEEFISEIQRKMLPYLNNEQLLQLRSVLDETFRDATVSYEISEDKPDELDVVEAFTIAKRIEGCSEKTLNYYRKTIEAMLSSIGKTAKQITTETSA